MAIHLEMIAGHHEDALFSAQPFDQHRRIDVVVVAHEHDRASLRRHMLESTVPGVQPVAHERIVAANDALRSSEQARATGGDNAMRASTSLKAPGAIVV